MAKEVKETPAMRLFDLEHKILNNVELTKKEAVEYEELACQYRDYLNSVEVINRVIGLFYEDEMTGAQLVRAMYVATQSLHDNLPTMEAFSTLEEDEDGGT